MIFLSIQIQNIISKSIQIIVWSSDFQVPEFFSAFHDGGQRNKIDKN